MKGDSLPPPPVLVLALLFLFLFLLSNKRQKLLSQDSEVQDHTYKP